MDKVD